MAQIDLKKINYGLHECSKGTSFMQEINSYVEHLYRIVIEEYNNVNKDIFSLFSIKVSYESLEINDSINLVLEFFKNIDSSLYDSYLNLIHDNEHTKIVYNKKEPSHVYNDNLFLNLQKSTRDICEICHESIHAIYNPKIYRIEEPKHVVRLLFNELNSITFERILNDKLEIDKDKFLYERFSSDLSKAIFYMFYNWLFKIYLKTHDINIDTINRELDYMNDSLLKDIFRENLALLLKNVECNYKYLGKYQVQLSRYILASTFSATIHKRLNEGLLTFDEYISNMNKLNKVSSFYEALEVLDLNYIKSSKILSEIKKNYNESCMLILESRKR